MNSVIAVERSLNKKIGDASATYVSQSSCPTTCPFIHNGCYAESGPIGIHTSRLNKSTVTNPIDIANQEAASIKEKLTGRYALRLHVVGDCSTDESARIVSESVKDYKKPVWSYTHSWREVLRKSWGKVSILASVETTSDIQKARKRNFATAIVVDQHISDKKYILNGEKIIPCPNETRKVVCSDCKLCMRSEFLLKNKLTIGFSAHGIGRKKVIERLHSTE